MRDPRYMRFTIVAIVATMLSLVGATSANAMTTKEHQLVKGWADVFGGDHMRAHCTGRIVVDDFHTRGELCSMRWRMTSDPWDWQRCDIQVIWLTKQKAFAVNPEDAHCRFVSTAVRVRHLHR